jgi:hypothetical protein
MLAATTASPGHLAVAIVLCLGAAGLAGLVVVMAWSVHVRQIRLAEQLTRRQFTVTAEATGAHAGEEALLAGDEAVKEAAKVSNGRSAPPVIVIDGPERVFTGEQARYRLRPAGSATVVSWAVGGGSVSQSPDPSHPDELLVIADRPGDLTVIARAREGMHERRATKSVTAVPEAITPDPPFTLRVFLHGWGLVAVAVLGTGFAAALDALGSLTSSDFIALTVPLAAMIAMVMAIGRGNADPPPRPRRHENRADPAAGAGHPQE